jgi:hypothetical protein
MAAIERSSATEKGSAPRPGKDLDGLGGILHSGLIEEIDRCQDLLDLLP